MDLTRSLRRAGGLATGIDRVELAYLRHLLADSIPVFGIVRTAFGYLLLDQSGLVQISRRLDGQTPWGSADLLSRLPRNRSPIRRAAEADFRRFSVARAIPQRLLKLLQRHMPDGFSYLNVGHSNLTQRMFNAVKKSAGAQISVLVHDVIPLDFPQLQRAGTVQSFETKMRHVVRFADRVICNSAVTQDRFLFWAKQWGDPPETFVAHLGVELPKPAQITLPKAPYFITVGTIEPRKNHALLLDIWQDLGPDAPKLLICGKRGWLNEDVFARLDALPDDGPVQEISNASDAEIAALVRGAKAALYPSVAEGYCLPAVEALAMGTPTICNNLAIFQEILGKKPVFAKIMDQQLWKDNIRRLANSGLSCKTQSTFNPPSWEEHFKIVLGFA